MQCDTFIVYEGWGKVSALLMNANLSGISNPKNTKDFIQIKVMGDAAWAMYKDNWTYENKGTTVTGSILCTMIFEKKVNEWKISSFSIHVPNN